MGTRIICLGNQDLSSDRYGHDTYTHLSKRGFKCSFCDSVDGFMHLMEEEDAPESIILIDAVRGLETTREIMPEELTNNPRTSLHDFDIGFFLRLKEALGESIGYRIIGIPQRKITEDTIDAVVRLIHQ